MEKFNLLSSQLIEAGEKKVIVEKWNEWLMEGRADCMLEILKPFGVIDAIFDDNNSLVEIWCK